MIRKSYMASTAFEGEQEISRGLAAIELIREEAEYLYFEEELLGNKEDFTLREGLKKASMNLKIILMEILKNKIDDKEKFSNVISLLKRE